MERSKCTGCYGDDHVSVHVTSCNGIISLSLTDGLKG